MTKVLGIDIGAKFVVAFSLESLPVGITYEDYYKKNAKTSISKIRMDNKHEDSTIKLEDAISLLKELKPDAIVMEPTGVWYSKLWGKLAEHLGIEVKWIGHSDLAFNRGAYGFPNKDDRTDAFCLAISYFHPDFTNQNKWLNWKTGLIADVNERVLELESLDRTTKVYLLQLRQRLKYEFPECADRAVNNEMAKGGYTAWVGWLADFHKSTRIENGYKKSIAVSLGIPITSYTRDHATSLATNQIRATEVKQKLTELLLSSEFDLYRPTFELMGFGIKMQGVLLSDIYPFEKFLKDGRPYIERWEDDVKKYKRNRSLASFQLSLGMGKLLVQSGGTSERVYSGSGFARTKLYTWIMKYVVPERAEGSWLVQELNRRSALNPNSPMTVKALREKWQKSTGSNSDRHKIGAGIAMTIAYRVTRILYDRLLNELTS